MGDEGWTYQRSAGGAANREGKNMSLSAEGRAGKDHEVDITELRIAISKLARREERCHVCRVSTCRLIVQK